jgi:hypothetical protein
VTLLIHSFIFIDNQVHYESLHPCSDKDIEKTKELEEAIRSGNYPYQKRI